MHSIEKYFRSKKRWPPLTPPHAQLYGYMWAFFRLDDESMVGEVKRTPFSIYTAKNNLGSATTYFSHTSNGKFFTTVLSKYYSNIPKSYHIKVIFTKKVVKNLPFDHSKCPFSRIMILKRNHFMTSTSLDGWRFWKEMQPFPVGE